jgi:hypothetical protein
VKRPSFQFYPGDWTSNSNLRRCTHAEKGIWMDVMCLMHDQEDYGILRWPLTEIAVAVGCTVAALRKIAEKGILKGADAGKQVSEFVYVPRSGRKDGEPVTLVCSQMGPLWYSSRMVKDEYVRTIRGESSRFGASDGDTPKPTPKGAPNPSFGDGSSASTSSSASPNTSAPNGADAVASRIPPDGMSAKEAIYHVGVPWLVERGVPDKNARSLMGGAMKQLGEDGAWLLAQQFMHEQPLEPAAWIAAAINAHMKPGAKAGRPNKQEALEARNRAVAERLAQEES